MSRRGDAHRLHFHAADRSIGAQVSLTICQRDFDRVSAVTTPAAAIEF
jgi:hypothetical protein